MNQKDEHFRGSLEQRGDRQVVPKRRYETTILRCVKFQKSADLIYIEAESSNHQRCIYFAHHRRPNLSLSA